MIKIEKVEVVGLEHAIRGMRNPMNSWDKSDSGVCGGENHIGCLNCSNGGSRIDCEQKMMMDIQYGYGIKPCGKEDFDGEYQVGHNDFELMTKLVKGGPVHAKYRRMIVVYLDIIAPLYWWKEFDTYKVGTVSNSCSTMHKIHDREFTIDDFSCEYLNKETMYLFEQIVNYLNISRDCYNSANKENDKEWSKDYWWQMIQLLPSSYNQKRTIMLNYEVLVGIYKWRHNHKLDEWVEFCKWIEKLPYSEIITGN